MCLYLLNALVLSLHSSEWPGGLTGCWSAPLPPPVSDCVGLGMGPRICSFNWLPDELDAAVYKANFLEPLLS